ncbi:MAG: beta-ketoacyl-ACP synthase II [Dehalococcoidia bacterium]|nr:beta-ketoacyl-ACP synthase II [Dehalococcoidia bacterium]
MGMLTPVGSGTAATWQGLISGASGIAPIALFDASTQKVRIAGEVKNFDPVQYMSHREADRMDRFAQLAVSAAKQALEQSGLEINAANAGGIGAIIGSGVGGIGTLFEQSRILIEKGSGRVSPFTVPMMTPDMAAAQVSMMFGLKGPCFGTTSACASGSDAIGIAFGMIRHGDAAAMLAGGTEAAVTPLGIAAFTALKALSTRNDDPRGASRPFDTERDGFVLSEGAAVLVLESKEHALSRGAEIMAEIVSYGASADACHITQPPKNGEGAARAMKLALNHAGLAPRQIGYINAHGTSTPLNDKAETAAIKSVFGNSAYRIPVSSTKSMTGHLLGAAGALEAAVCALVIKEGIIPPTVNLTSPDPDCDLDYVPLRARRTRVDFALSNSFGFGGHNSTLVIGRYSEATA